jgi:hypothetical protein
MTLGSNSEIFKIDSQLICMLNILFTSTKCNSYNKLWVPSAHCHSYDHLNTGGNRICPMDASTSEMDPTPLPWQAEVIRVHRSYLVVLEID